MSLKSIRESNVTIRRTKKKQQARGLHANPSLDPCIPLYVRLADPSTNSLSPSATIGALRAKPIITGDK